MKADNMKITEYFNETGEYITRDLTAAELAQRKTDEENDFANLQAIKAEAKAKETAKAALLNKLGITAEEAVLLLS
jgi:hypothetical protein